MATINHKTYNEATETFKDFNVYDGKETLIFKVDGSEGNVGIGTTDPQTILNDFSTSARGLAISNSYPLLGFSDTDGGKFFIGTQANIGYIWNNGTSDIVVATNAAERMRITSTGNVGIGTSSPSYKLDVDGDTRLGITASPKLYMLSTGGNGNNERFYIEGYADGGTYGGGFKLATRNDYNIFNTAVTVDRNGNVGIGTTSPESKLHIASSAAGSDVTLYVDNNAASTLNNSARLKFSADAGASVSGGGAELNCLNVNAGNGAVDLFIKSWTGASYTEKVRFPAAGGITFNGDTAAANALDDYEEGTWTPVLIAAGGGGQASYTTQLGTYTKIGRQVTATFHLVFTKGTLSGGTLQLTAFPFTAEANMYPEAALLFDNLAIDLSNPLIQKAASNSGSDFIADNGSTGTHSGLAVNTYLSAGTMTCRATVTYFV